MNRLFALAVLLILVLGGHRVLADSLPGRLVTIDAFESQHVASRKVVIWLPSTYDEDVASGHARYAVLYMHDARNLFDPTTSMGGQTWGVAEAATRLLAAGKIQKTIIVGIDNTPARSREYMPEKVYRALTPSDQAIVSKAMGGEPLSDAYLKFIVEEIKPYIDKTYATRPDRAHTFIMGSSMGGLISLYALAEFPDRFGGAGCLSTHWPLPAIDTQTGKPLVAADASVQAFRQYLQPKLNHWTGHRLWFDHGTETLDKLYAPYQEQIDGLLREHKPPLELVWSSRTYLGAAHNEASWRAHIEDPLIFLLGTPVGRK